MKTIIITGVTSGLGKALLDLLVKKDLHLICLSRRFLSEQRNLLKINPHLQLINCDLRNSAELDFIVKTQFQFPSVVEEMILLNNASVISPLGSIGSSNLDKIALIESLHVNLISPIMLTNELLFLVNNNMLFKSTKLKIINISTGAAYHPVVGWSIYCAGKAGAAQFYQNLKEQVKNNTNILVDNFDPGVMDTPMQEKIRLLPLEKFPRREEFIRFQEKGMLKSPLEIAQKIITTYSI